QPGKRNDLDRGGGELTVLDEPVKNTILSLEEVKELEHIYIGPTWMRDEDGRWKLPEYTLGWEIAGWCAQWLRGLGDDEERFRFTKEQLRFILWWFAVDEDGAFIYRTGVLQRLKGWGKDPLLAVISLVELIGPSRFSHWEGGQPVAKPCDNALVHAVAVSQDQTYNTMDMIPALLTDEVIAEYGIKIGQEIIRANGGRCKFQAVTSSYRALEGKRTTFTLLNETQHWITANGGHKLYETIDGNATKIKGRYLAITNAYLPGQASVAARMREHYEMLIPTYGTSGRFLYDSREANPLTPLTPEAARHVFRVIRGDSVWLDIDDIVDTIINSGMPPSRSRRMW